MCLHNLLRHVITPAPLGCVGERARQRERRQPVRRAHRVHPRRYATHQAQSRSMLTQVDRGRTARHHGLTDRELMGQKVPQRRLVVRAERPRLTNRREALKNTILMRKERQRSHRSERLHMLGHGLHDRHDLPTKPMGHSHRMETRLFRRIDHGPRGVHCACHTVPRVHMKRRSDGHPSQHDRFTVLHQVADLDFHARIRVEDLVARLDFARRQSKGHLLERAGHQATHDVTDNHGHILFVADHMVASTAHGRHASKEIRLMSLTISNDVEDGMFRQGLCQGQESVRIHDTRGGKAVGQQEHTLGTSIAKERLLSLHEPRTEIRIGFRSNTGERHAERLHIGQKRLMKDRGRATAEGHEGHAIGGREKSEEMMERVLDVLETPLIVHGGGDVQQQAQVERGAHKGGRELSLLRLCLDANHGPLGVGGNGVGVDVHVLGGQRWKQE